MAKLGKNCKNPLLTKRTFAKSTLDTRMSLVYITSDKARASKYPLLLAKWLDTETQPNVVTVILVCKILIDRMEFRGPYRKHGTL